MSVMLYKSPGQHEFHGVSCEYCIVAEGDVEVMESDGWCRTPAEAAEAAKPAEKKVTKKKVAKKVSKKVEEPKEEADE